MVLSLNQENKIGINFGNNNVKNFNEVSQNKGQD